MFPWENHWIVIHMEKIRGFENAGSGNAVMIFYIILWLFTSIPGAYYESLRTVCRPCGFLEIQSGMVPNATDNAGRNATVTNQPAAVRCPGQYCRCLHIGTACVPKYCHEIGRRSAGVRRASVRKSADSLTGIPRWNTHRTIIGGSSAGRRRTSGGLPCDIRHANLFIRLCHCVNVL